MVNYSQAFVTVDDEQITLLNIAKESLCIYDTSQDRDLSRYLQIAGDAAERYTQNKLARQSAVESFTCRYSPVYLRYWPFVSLDQVLIDGDDVTEDYVARVADGVASVWVERESGTHERVQMRVTYTCGYEPLPADLGHVISTAAISFMDGSAGAVRKESVVGIGSIEYASEVQGFGAFTSASLSILNRYRRIHV